MEPWQVVLSVKTYEDYTVRQVDLPVYNEIEYGSCIGKCRECEERGRTWACPPNMDIDPQSLYDSCKYALLVRRTFCLDVKNDELVDATSAEMQRIVRMMVTDLRSNKVDCMGFADGGCRYCGVCACPEPCRFPDMLIRSISSLGIDMKEYLSRFGIEFSFAEKCYTLYGLIFVRKSD